MLESENAALQTRKGPKRARSAVRAPFRFAGVEIRAGRLRKFEIPAATLPTGSQISMPVAVLHGREDGPHLFLTAAIHGDELNGIEIIRGVLNSVSPSILHGTIVAVPLVNLFGFITQSRYTPDRRDLNRSFPGSSRGSLAARSAHLLTEHLLGTCEYGIDLHTATNHRFNLPQIRADLSDPETLKLAKSFGTSVLLNAPQREGSLRATMVKKGVRVLLFEGGQADHFDKDVIEAGINGVVRVLNTLGMVEEAPERPKKPPAASFSSRWVRARKGGLFRPSVELGSTVREGDLLGSVSDVFGAKASRARSPMDGIVISLATNPLVNPGDGLVHVAKIDEK